MNAYRIQIVLVSTLLCILAGNIILAPLNVVVSILGIQEVLNRKSGEQSTTKRWLAIVIFLAVVLLVITFFELMLSYMDILFALM